MPHKKKYDVQYFITLLYLHVNKNDKVKQILYCTQNEIIIFLNIVLTVHQIMIRYIMYEHVSRNKA